MKVILVGAGGHARNIIEMLSTAGHELVGYVDPDPCSWIARQRWAQDSDTDSVPDEVGIVFGIGGVTPTQLKKRAELFNRYRERGRATPAIIHRQAVVSPSAVVGEGSHIMAGAVLQAASTIGCAVIVNTGAIVEHDSQIGDGVHVAPGAIVLGAVTVGAFSMIGAGSVVLQGASVQKGTLVKAGTRFPHEQA